jgi:hypothetical protein
MSTFGCIRKKKAFRYFAVFLAVNLLTEIFMPTMAMALTSGPTQPELQSFEPAGTSDMVNLFSGDFNYNIPLFDLPGPDGGYPFNIAYHSGIGMDQEASWVGLGWNINPGSINRDKRGLPDDFRGDGITRDLDMKPNVTCGIITGINIEIFGADMQKGLGVGTNVTIYQNSYKGVGYSFSSSLNYMTATTSVGVGFSMDSQDGVGGNASLSYTKTMTQANPTYGAGIGYNSQRGLSISASGRIGTRPLIATGAGMGRRGGIGGTSTYSFAEKAYSPSFPVEMKGNNRTATIKVGVDLVGVFGNFTIGGFVREESVADVTKFYRGYGYNYLEAKGDTDRGNPIMDFNREKDGVIRNETPCLPSPSLTFDTYTATSQGFSGSYRAHRNDVGRLHDPYVESHTKGGAIGFDIGFGIPLHLGVAGSMNNSVTSSGDWSDENDFINSFNYTSPVNTQDYAYEKLYYKIKGEPTTYNTDELDHIGGEYAVRASLKRHGDDVDSYYSPEQNVLVTSSGPNSANFNNLRQKSLKRIKRNNSIQPITNELLLDDANKELVNAYKIEYNSNLTADPTNAKDYLYTSYSRAEAKTGRPSHNAGFTCVNPDGMRYIYALPAYNGSEEEIAYTHSSSEDLTNSNYVESVGNNQSYKDDANSEQFFSRNATPKYAHGYLLTAVVGADYIDMKGDGVTDDDYGYWVKFNYAKTSEEYKWRIPYEGGVFLKGLNIPNSDDKVMFNYGAKEIWYLASAETKSHIAVFKLSERKDGRGATKRYTDDNNVSVAEKLYKLDEINLYAKANFGSSSVALKTIHFTYTYDLCGKVTNNLSPASDPGNYNQGKLTLKSLWTTYQNSTRGSLSPYTFDYAERISPSQIDLVNNPNYQIACDNTNRWGGYRNNDDFFKGINLPYVSQFSQNPAVDEADANVKQEFKNKLDASAAVWNLKKIGLPTGGSITVQYESDDYGYVQNKQATQMFKILSLGNRNKEKEIYAAGERGDGEENRRVYFKLENPILVNDANANQKFFDSYIAGLKQEDGTYPMYFRINTDLRNNKYEDVTGYCDLEPNLYGLTDNDGVYYRTGYITVKLIPKENSRVGLSGDVPYHPFAVSAWQFLRTNMPHLLTAFGNLGNASEGSSDLDKAARIKSLLSVIPAALKVFKGYRNYAWSQNWGRIANLDKSMIRLCSPDRMKYGGGLRVKKLIFNDGWEDQPNSTGSGRDYGQVYDYSITDKNGVRYSSGVAQYEPMIGGDEIALRHPKKYVENIPVATDNNLFFEFPVNESLYPGASVGYRKVTVQSIASKEAAITSGTTPAASTTGKVVYEFYTAKDFPVITDYTDNQPRPFNLYIPIPLIGEININKLFATQGYAITTNNMHGQQKAVTTYGKNIHGELTDKVINSIRYEYKSEKRQYDGQTVNVLLNKVPAIINESVNSSNGIIECNKQNEVIIGEEYDFFTDARQSKIHSENIGIDANVLIFPVGLSLPLPWPSGGYNVNELKTFVTNKLISKTGVLEKIVAFDGFTTVTTENKLFDAQTGSPLLTTVTNDYGNPIYNYTHPAFWDYKGMTSAAINDGFRFYATVKDVEASKHTFTINDQVYMNHASNPVNRLDLHAMLEPGDEFIIGFDNINIPYKTAGRLISNDLAPVCTAGSTSNILFHTEEQTQFVFGPNDKLVLTVVRSGRRNILTTQAGVINALKDPTDNANRERLPLAGTSTGCMSNEVALLLNTRLTDPDHYLTVGKTPISKDIYPILGNTYTEMEVEEGICSNDQLVYNLIFSYVDQNGACQKVTCNCAIRRGAVNNGVTTIYRWNSFQGAFVNGQCKLRGNLYQSVDGQFFDSDLSCLVQANLPGYTYIDDVIHSSAVTFNDFSDYVKYDLNAINTINPSDEFANGKKGIWKPFTDYYYKDARVNQQLGTMGVDVKLDHDGVYKGEDTVAAPKNEFYVFNWQPTLRSPLPHKWLPNNVMTWYDQNSNAVETKDILNLYSGVIYGYDGKLSIMQGKNARQNELFFECFEEAIHYTPGGDAVPSDITAHTGKKSLKVNSGTMKLDRFKPQPDKSYNVSLWMSQNIQPATYAKIVSGNDTVGIRIEYYANNGSYLGASSIISPTGNVIEKWQRVEGKFTPVANTASIAIKFVTLGNVYYFDDVRISPINSSINSSVYDPTNFRIIAVLDHNNFATFYNYDEEGKLFMVKKETVAGIKTIQETRTHIAEKP